MKYLLTLFCLLLAHTFVSAQDATNLRISAADDAYDIQENVSIKTRDGAVLSATVVRRTGKTEPLPAVLFYTTYDQGARDSAIYIRVPILK